MSNSKLIGLVDMKSGCEDELIIATAPEQVPSRQFTPPECLGNTAIDIDMKHYFTEKYDIDTGDGLIVVVDYSCVVYECFVLLSGYFNYYFDRDGVFISRLFFKDEQHDDG